MKIHTTVLKPEQQTIVWWYGTLLCTVFQSVEKQVFSFQWLRCIMREGLGKVFQRLKCMQEWYLGWEKVSCLEQFRSVLSLEMSS